MTGAVKWQRTKERLDKLFDQANVGHLAQGLALLNCGVGKGLQALALQIRSQGCEICSLRKRLGMQISQRLTHAG